MKAGFIGLGGMGRPIARNILRAGFDLIVTDVREEPVRELVAEGAGAVRSAAEAAAADIVLASLPTNEASVEVGAEVVSAAKPGTVYADLSTITPAVIKRLADQGERRGVEVLDAPVSGGMRQREEGTLAVMVGGTAEAFAKARPVFEAFGGEIHHVGAVGAGATIKLINNLAMATSAVATMEALVLGVKAGLDPETVRRVVGASSGSSRVFEWLCGWILTRSSVPGPLGPHQGMRTIVKDTRLAAELADELEVPLLAGAAAVHAFADAEAKGLSDREWWGLIEVFEERAGVRVRPPGL